MVGKLRTHAMSTGCDSDTASDRDQELVIGKHRISLLSMAAYFSLSERLHLSSINASSELVSKFGWIM